MFKIVTFVPTKEAKKVRAAIGEVGKSEEVEEERIEVICRKEKVKEVVAAIKKIHPYEEIPIEIYKLVLLPGIR